VADGLLITGIHRITGIDDGLKIEAANAVGLARGNAAFGNGIAKLAETTIEVTVATGARLAGPFVTELDGKAVIVAATSSDTGMPSALFKDIGKLFIGTNEQAAVETNRAVVGVLARWWFAEAFNTFVILAIEWAIATQIARCSFLAASSTGEQGGGCQQD